MPSKRTQLFSQPPWGRRENRLNELSWLLSQIQDRGISGWEARIGEVMQWQDLQAEEQPLAQELFVVAGRQSLHQNHFTHAEQYFSHAYHLLPSADIARLLAMVEERRNPAQQDNQGLRTCEDDQWTIGLDLSTPAPARRATQERAPHTAAHAGGEWERYKGAGLGGALVLLLLVAGGVSVRQMRERPLAPATHRGGPPATLQEQPVARQEESSSLGTAEKIDDPVSTETSAGGSKGADETQWGFDEWGADEESQKDTGGIEKLPKGNNLGKVTTAASLGLRVSGAGRAEPARSLAAIQAGIEDHLSELGAAYDIERVTAPALMGHLILDLTIEPDGRTSRVRLHSTKLLSQGLQKRVLALARTWSFSPAAGRVRVSYPLLFLPPEMDPASILSWERGMARVRSEESIPPSVPHAGAADSVVQVKPEETRRRASYSTPLVVDNEAETTQADAEHEGGAVSRGSLRTGRHFVHPVVEYSITPPAGFKLVRIGQRTVWQGPEGTQLLVETTLSPGPEARVGWEQLHAAFVKKYRNRYRPYGIKETHLAGRPAAAWEFALTTAAGTTYKRDVAVLDRGVGYGILVSAPAERFAAWRSEFETALQSFRLPLKRPGA